MKPVVERFLRYISINTQADENESCCPSNKNQIKLANMLVSELHSMGIENAYCDERGYVYSHIKSNTNKNISPIAFFAHLDTAPEASGENINPRIVKNYDGKKIQLNEELNIYLDPKEFPSMLNNIGDDLIVTDGKTLLGADDKAGIAEIMEACKYIMENPNFKHGDIHIIFTPDEEIGYSMEFIDVNKIPVKYGFTVDGGSCGELNYENFNAATANIIVNGKSIHPGSAKDKMKNAILLANEFISLLPNRETPVNTEGYEGFYHITNINGDVSSCTITCSIRDFDTKNYEYRKNRIIEIGEFLNNYYGNNTFDISVEDYYFNMKSEIDKYPQVIEIIKSAMNKANIDPKIIPVRGGTDGTSLSFMGIPCPNIFAGFHNCHGVYEYASVQTMEASIKVILNIISIFEEDDKK